MKHHHFRSENCKVCQKLAWQSTKLVGQLAYVISFLSCSVPYSDCIQRSVPQSAGPCRRHQGDACRSGCKWHHSARSPSAQRVVWETALVTSRRESTEHPMNAREPAPALARIKLRQRWLISLRRTDTGACLVGYVSVFRRTGVSYWSYRIRRVKTKHEMI